MLQKLKQIVFLGLLLSLLGSCNNQIEFTIEGIVKDAGGETLILEKRGFSDVSVVDSVKLSEDGTFSLKGAAPETPDLYVLRLGSQAINIAVDSTEIIRIETSKDAFSVNYTVSGSPATERMRDVLLAKSELQKMLAELKTGYEAKNVSAEEYLSQLSGHLDSYKDIAKRVIIIDTKSPAAYFTLFQKIDDNLIFDPYERIDSRMYSAVATAWDMYYKDSPRAKHLRDFTLRSIKARRDAETKVDLSEYVRDADGSNFYNIELVDIHNNKVSLNSLKGKVVLLDFTLYQSEFSPIHNIMINKIYQKYKDKMEVYQVAFDPDLHVWQNAGSNLPWICVRDASLSSSELVGRFNLQQLPTSYLLNANGEIVKRLSPTDSYEAELKKLL